MKKINHTRNIMCNVFDGAGNTILIIGEMNDGRSICTSRVSYRILNDILLAIRQSFSPVV